MGKLFYSFETKLHKEIDKIDHEAMFSLTDFIMNNTLFETDEFVDGNGRTAKLVMNLSLLNSGYLPVIEKKKKD